MPEQFREDMMDKQGAAGGGAFPHRPGRRLRIVREPAFTGAELLAFALILTMACGPLALGAMRF